MPRHPLPILYIKSNCPWCRDAVAFLSEHGIGYLEKNVTEDAGAFTEMKRVSGQDRAPTLDWHGDILADFGLDELKPFLLKHEAPLEDS